MDPNNDITRMHVEDDRLSSLPDDLIHKIFSFIGFKYAIKMTSLSSRWRFFWTSLPYVNFATEDFFTMLNFSMFVYHAMSRRNTQIQVFSLHLIFRGKVKQLFVKRIMRSVFSHNVKQLIVTSFRDRTIIEYPLSFLSSQSLKHLTFTGSYTHSVNTTSTREMPRLTTLHLENVTFYDKITDKTSISLFSKCANLKNLTLKYCSMKGSSTGVNPPFIIPMSALEFPTLATLHLHFITLSDYRTDKGIGLFSKCAHLKNLTLSCFKTMELNGFTICHPRLSNLTLQNVDNCMEVVNVVAPQLENLTIRNCRAKHVICAPHLASFFYKGSYPLRLSADGFQSLEKANICISSPNDVNEHELLFLFQQLHSVKFLALNSEIIKCLSTSMELFSHQPSPFANLERLKIYPDYISSLMKNPNEKVTISSEVKNYFLNSSPSATFTMVSNEVYLS